VKKNKKMSEHYQRLEEFLNLKGYTINSLSDELKISQGRIGYYKEIDNFFSPQLIKLLKTKFPDLDVDYLKGKSLTPFKKLNQNVVAEEGPVYNPRKPQENYQMQTIDHEFLLAITKQLEVKDDQIRTLTKIIENITTK